MVGQFFLTFNEDGRVQWAGEVLAWGEDEEVYIVRLVNWFTGSMADERPVRVSEMQGWEFYGSEKEAQDAYERLRQEGRAG
jgi:hypothetical protein